MTNPVAAPGPVPVAPLAAPVVTPAPSAPVPASAAVDPTAAPVAESDGSDDQAILARQMSARFSVVKKSGGGDTGEASPAPASTPPPAAAAPTVAAAPQEATLPSTTG